MSWRYSTLCCAALTDMHALRIVLFDTQTGVKRVVVIVAAVIFFANPVSAQNAAGTAIALGGVFAYGQVSWTARHTLNVSCL